MGLSGPHFFQLAYYGRKWSEMTGKTVLMLQTRQNFFRIVPKCPLKTHRCSNGLVFQLADYGRIWSERTRKTKSPKIFQNIQKCFRRIVVQTDLFL